VRYLGDVATCDVGSTTRSTHLRAELNKTSRRSATRTERGQVPHGLRNRLRMATPTTLVRESNPHDRSSRVCISAPTVTVLRHIDLAVGESSCENFLFSATNPNSGIRAKIMLSSTSTVRTHHKMRALIQRLLLPYVHLFVPRRCLDDSCPKPTLRINLRDRLHN
jgi:hypothetical protein